MFPQLYGVRGADTETSVAKAKNYAKVDRVCLKEQLIQFTYPVGR